VPGLEGLRRFQVVTRRRKAQQPQQQQPVEGFVGIGGRGDGIGGSAACRRSGSDSSSGGSSSSGASCGAAGAASGQQDGDGGQAPSSALAWSSASTLAELLLAQPARRRREWTPWLLGGVCEALPDWEVSVDRTFVSVGVRSQRPSRSSSSSTAPGRLESRMMDPFSLSSAYRELAVLLPPCRGPTAAQAASIAELAAVSAAALSCTPSAEQEPEENCSSEPLLDDGAPPRPPSPPGAAGVGEPLLPSFGLGPTLAVAEGGEQTGHADDAAGRGIGIPGKLVLLLLPVFACTGKLAVASSACNEADSDCGDSSIESQITICSVPECNSSASTAGDAAAGPEVVAATGSQQGCKTIGAEVDRSADSAAGTAAGLHMVASPASERTSARSAVCIEQGAVGEADDDGDGMEPTAQCEPAVETPAGGGKKRRRGRAKGGAKMVVAGLAGRPPLAAEERPRGLAEAASGGGGTDGLPILVRAVATDAAAAAVAPAKRAWPATRSSRRARAFSAQVPRRAATAGSAKQLCSEAAAVLAVLSAAALSAAASQPLVVVWGGAPCATAPAKAQPPKAGSSRAERVTANGVGGSSEVAPGLVAFGSCQRG